MRPLDRRAKRVLARFRIAAAFQEIEALGEPVEDLRRREHTGAGRGELDGEREVVEAATELGGRLVRSKPAPLTEKRHSLRLGEGRHGVLDFAAHTQQLAAGHEQMEVRADLDERGEVGCDFDDLLQVVEQEQQLPLADVVGEAVFRAEGLPDRFEDKCRVTQHRKADPEHAGLELSDQLRSRLDREPRLARPARPAQRDEPMPAHQLRHLSRLPLTPDVRGRRPRQVRIGDRLEGWEALLAELEDRHRLGEVLQPMLAEVGHAAVQQRPRCRRQQHLPTVPRGRDPRTEMDVLADVTFPRQKRLAGVQPHSDPDQTGLERQIRRRHSSDCRPRIGEHVEERITLRVHLDAVLGGENRTKHPPMLCQRLRVRLRPELAAAAPSTPRRP